MAKIQAGILSNVRGAVAGVVGGVWKGQNYLRARVTPANPNTVAQQAQRTKLADCVAFAKLILGSVLQPFVDPFQKVMSGYNWFVKKNIALFIETPVYSSMTLCEGTLFAAAIDSVDHDEGTVTAAFESTLGQNGLATDLVTAVFRRASDGRVFSAGTPALRSAGTITIEDAALAVSGSTGTMWLITYREVDSKVTMVGNSNALDG
jgi:hypothetical protein